MVLRTLDAMGPQHGFGLAKRILQVSEGLLDLNQKRSIPRSCGSNSDDGLNLVGASRKTIGRRSSTSSRRGRRQIREETASWRRPWP